MLIDCKTWNGPVTSGEELIKAMKSRPSQEKFILRTELAYYTHTHRTDKIQRPELYQQNGIDQEEKLENMLILLSDKYEHCHATTANLPTNEDAVQALLSHRVTSSTSQSP